MLGASRKVCSSPHEASHTPLCYPVIYLSSSSRFLAGQEVSGLLPAAGCAIMALEASCRVIFRGLCDFSPDVWMQPVKADIQHGQSQHALPTQPRAAVMVPLICCGSSRAQETFMQWDQCRRFYNFLMADNMKKIILSHRYATFSSVSGGASG